MSFEQSMEELERKRERRQHLLDLLLKAEPEEVESFISLAKDLLETIRKAN